jgi:hypothetical protein
MSSTFREEDNGTVEIDLVPDVNTTLEECSLVCKLPGVTVVTRLITLVRIVFVLMGTARVVGSHHAKAGLTFNIMQ